jgi:hypothetical protein
MLEEDKGDTGEMDYAELVELVDMVNAQAVREGSVLTS